MFFFFNDTATTEIYTLSLHDALPIYDFGDGERAARLPHGPVPDSRNRHQRKNALDRSAAEWRRPLRDWSRRLGSPARAADPGGGVSPMGFARRIPGAGRIPGAFEQDFPQFRCEDPGRYAR